MQNKNYNQPELTVQEQTKVRIEKLDKLKEKGVEPFGTRFDVKDKICERGGILCTYLKKVHYPIEILKKNTGKISLYIRLKSKI